LPYHHGNLRQVLLEEAAEAIREGGVGRLSLRDLARRAGVSHGAPARHFADRAALLTALATDALEQFQAALLGGMAEAGDSAIDRHRAIGMGYIRFAHFASGYILAVGFLFRIYWAFMGNHHARQLFLPPFWRSAFWDGVWHEIKWYAFMAKEPRK